MPEEVNRISSDRISSWHFAQTQTASQKLLNEGLKQDDIHLVGDVIYDVELHYGSRAKSETGVHSKLNLRSDEYMLATIQRAEKTNNPTHFNQIIEALMRITERHKIVWSMHPRTR